MSNLVIILGSSGTGKSTSIKTLNPKETVILNVLGKDLPFKGSRVNYTKEKLNHIQSANWEQIQSMMQSISKNKPEIHNIVIDDAIYIMRTEFFDRSRERGFDILRGLRRHYGREYRNDGHGADNVAIGRRLFQYYSIRFARGVCGIFDPRFGKKRKVEGGRRSFCGIRADIYRS